MSVRAVPFFVLFVACGGADEATQTVGAGGGTVVSDDGNVTLTIPAGALDAVVDIGIAPAADASGFHGDIAYELTPHGLAFAERVTFEMTLDLLPDDPSAMALARRHDDGTFEIWPDSTITGNTIVATIDGFSTQGSKSDAKVECFDVYMDSDSRTVVIDRGGSLLAIERAVSRGETALDVSALSFDTLVRGGDGTLVHRDVLGGDGAMYWYRKPGDPCVVRIPFFGIDAPTPPDTCAITAQAWREQVAPNDIATLPRNTVAHMSPSPQCLSGVSQPDVSWFELLQGEGGQPMPVFLGSAPSWQHWIANQTRIRIVVAETAGGGSETVREIEQSFLASALDFISTGRGPYDPVPAGTGFDLGAGDAITNPMLDTHGEQVGMIQYELWREDAAGEFTYMLGASLMDDDWPAADNGTAALAAGRYFLRTRAFSPDLSRTVTVSSPFPIDVQ